jgi:hypothetical protein
MPRRRASIIFKRPLMTFSLLLPHAYAYQYVSRLRSACLFTSPGQLFTFIFLTTVLRSPHATDFAAEQIAPDVDRL